MSSTRKMSAGPSVPGATDALKRFELENNISEIDQIYSYDNAEQQQHLQGNPWRADPKYFKKVRISATALIKMVMHARSGGISGNYNIEVMGLMQGKIDTSDPGGPTFIVMDTFALPVEATETRVNAQADAYEYMVEYQSMARDAGRLENVVGWYHSHPGYGCWLSGIDVATQMLNQQFQEPWLAVVIDPTRTVSAGKVEIGAFRSYPEGYKPPDAVEDGFQSVPLEKAEDFGAHANQYYPLDISYFKSSLDTSILNTLWNKYWIATLSASPVLSNSSYMTSQIKDLADKIEQAEGTLSHMRGGGGGSYLGPSTADRGGKKDETQLRKVVKDSPNLCREHLQGLMAQISKGVLFNPSRSVPPTAAAMDTSG